MSYWEQYKRAGRNDLPALLLLAWVNQEIEDDTVREELPHAYNAAEWPCRYVDVDVWLGAIYQLGWVGDLDRPTETIHVYRSQVGPDPGLSWTPDLKVAEFFNRRNIGFGFDDVRIMEHDAEPEHVVGMFTGREGVELLIDPYEVEEFGLQ